MFSGFAGVYLSGSPSRSGENSTRISRISIINKAPRMSLIV